MKLRNLPALRKYSVASGRKLGTAYGQVKETLKIHEQRRLHHSVKGNCALVLRDFRFVKRHFNGKLGLLDVLFQILVNSENVLPDIRTHGFQRN